MSQILRRDLYPSGGGKHRLTLSLHLSKVSNVVFAKHALATAFHIPFSLSEFIRETMLAYHLDGSMSCRQAK